MDIVEIDIPKDIYEFFKDKAKEKGVTIEGYIKEIYIAHLSKTLSEILDKDD